MVKWGSSRGRLCFHLLKRLGVETNFDIKTLYIRRFPSLLVDEYVVTKVHD